MRWKIRPLAEAEIHDAYDYLVERSAQAAERFLDDLDAALQRAAAFPESAEEVTPGLRHLVLNHFPYSLFYKIADHYLDVVAVVHHHRHPRVWKSRV